MVVRGRGRSGRCSIRLSACGLVRMRCRFPWVHLYRIRIRLWSPARRHFQPDSGSRLSMHSGDGLEGPTASLSVSQAKTLSPVQWTVERHDCRCTLVLPQRMARRGGLAKAIGQLLGKPLLREEMSAEPGRAPEQPKTAQQHGLRRDDGFFLRKAAQRGGCRRLPDRGKTWHRCP